MKLAHIFFFIMILFSIQCCTAQISFPTYIHAGENFTLSMSNYTGYTVSISTPNATIYSVICNTDYITFPDDFNAFSLTPGNYSINILDRDRKIVYTELKHVSPSPILTLVSISDIHHVNTRSQFRHVVNGINNETHFHIPDAVIMNGDLVNSAHSLPSFKSIADTLRCPYYPIPDAHDRTDELYGQYGSEWYRVFGKKYCYNTSINNVNLIFAGAKMDYAPLVDAYGDEFTDESNQEWFNNTISPSKMNILFVHKPLVAPRTNGTIASLGYILDANITNVLNIIDSNNVPLVVSGHNHIVSKNTVTNTTYICDGSCAEVPYVYSYIEIYNGYISVKTIQQNNLSRTYTTWHICTDSDHPTVELYNTGTEDERFFSYKTGKIVNTVIEVLDYNLNSTYMGRLYIHNASIFDTINVSLYNISNCGYKLYSIYNGLISIPVMMENTASFTITNVTDGVYDILKMDPTIIITQSDPHNVSSNVEFVLSGSTPVTDISYILNNVTLGNTYKMYDPATLAIYGSGSVIGSNATINVTGLPDGRYRIAETGSERILFTYWDSSNASCNGIFQIWNSTPVTNVRLVLSNVTPNTRYSLIEPLSHVTRGWGIASTNATIDVKGLQDGVYWIVGDSNSSFVNPVIIGVAFVGAAFVGASFINRWFQKRRGA